MPLRARRLFYTCYIESTLDYCSVVWGNCDQSYCNKLFKLQKQAIRLVCGTKWDQPTGPLFKTLGLLPLSDRLKYHTGVQMFQIVNGTCPKYLHNLFQPANVHSSRSLRSTSTNNLYLPRIRTEIMRKSLSYSGALLWNDLPLSLKNSPNLSSFKSQFYKILLDRDWQTCICFLRRCTVCRCFCFVCFFVMVFWLLVRIWTCIFFCNVVYFLMSTLWKIGLIGRTSHRL